MKLSYESIQDRKAWEAAGVTLPKFDWKDMAAPHPEVSTAYTSHVLGCMAEIAQELKCDEDAAVFRRYSEGCRKAYQEMAETAGYSLDTDRQARLVRPLAIALLDGEQTA